MVDFTVVPERMALVNVDMQNCFVYGSPFSAPDGQAVLDRINRVAATCRAAGILVIHASHVLRLDGSNTGVLGDIVPLLKQGTTAKSSETAALHSRLVVESRDILFEKPRFGAFHGTDLELILRSRGIDTLIVTCLATNVCVAKQPRARPRCVTFVCSSCAKGLRLSLSGTSPPPRFKELPARLLGFCSRKY